MSQSVVITGGHGSLAQALVRYMAEKEPAWDVYCPSRHQVDVACEQSITSYLKECSCDLLIAAAGEVADGPLARVSSREWDRLLHSNLRGAAYAAKVASKTMLKKRCGHIIFIGSYSGFHPPAGQIAYASAKAALAGLTKSLAREWGNANIRVNLILPGFLENSMTSQVSNARKAQVLEQHCLHRYNTESAVASFVHALHTQLPHTSGQTFNLDSRILTE